MQYGVVFSQIKQASEGLPREETAIVSGTGGGTGHIIARSGVKAGRRFIWRNPNHSLCGLVPRIAQVLKVRPPRSRCLMPSIHWLRRCVLRRIWLVPTGRLRLCRSSQRLPFFPLLQRPRAKVELGGSPSGPTRCLRGGRFLFPAWSLESLDGDRYDALWVTHAVNGPTDRRRVEGKRLFARAGRWKGLGLYRTGGGRLGLGGPRAWAHRLGFSAFHCIYWGPGLRNGGLVTLQILEELSMSRAEVGVILCSHARASIHRSRHSVTIFEGGAGGRGHFPAHFSGLVAGLLRAGARSSGCYSGHTLHLLSGIIARVRRS